MIQSSLDLAHLLADAVQRETAHEALAREPVMAAFITPPQVTFVVRTVEGRAYRVTITEEAQ